MKALYREKLSMDLEFIGMLMEMSMKENGKTINNRETVSSNLQMDQYMKVNSLRANPKEKEYINTSLFNMMILSSIVAHGLLHSLMDSAGQYIITETYTKASL